MSTLTKTYQSVDKTLDTGLIDLRRISRGHVHTIMSDVENWFFGLGIPSLNSVYGMIGKVGNVVDLIKNAPERIMNQVKGAIDDAINRILNSPLFGFVGDILSLLVSLDNLGLKSFLSGEIKAGNLAMCDNLDLLQGMFSGITIPKNILDGLFSGLAIDWLARICKPYSRYDELNASNRDKLEMVVPYGGTPVFKDQMWDNFSGLTSGLLNSEKEVVRESRLLILPGDLSDMVRESNMDNVRDIIQGIHLPRQDKVMAVQSLMDEFYLTKDKRRASKQDRLAQELLLLEAKGIAEFEPKFSRKDVIKAKTLPRAKDALGTFIVNLADIDFKEVNQFGIDEQMPGLYDKLVLVREFGQTYEFTSRGKNSGAFHSFDFSSIKDIFTEDELATFRSMKASDYSHRWNGLHPTSEIFVGDEVPYTKRRQAIKPGA